MFVGNVMTSRVNRDSIRQRGSSLQAIEEPDFLVSDDPWFRPVDLQVAPDGSLYIADFYNKIIGHVEVPLNHPGRDKRPRAASGGSSTRATADKPAPLDPSPDLRRGRREGADRRLRPPHPGRPHARRRRALRPPRGRGRRRRCARRSPGSRRWPAPTPSGAFIAWGRSAPRRSATAATSSDRLLRVHAMRILAETPTWDESDRSAVLHALDDRAPMVRRAAVDALGRHPRADDVDVLVELWKRRPRLMSISATRSSWRCWNRSGSPARSRDGPPASPRSRPPT